MVNSYFLLSFTYLFNHKYFEENWPTKVFNISSLFVSRTYFSILIGVHMKFSFRVQACANDPKQKRNQEKGLDEDIVIMKIHIYRQPSCLQIHGWVNEICVWYLSMHQWKHVLFFQLGAQLINSLLVYLLMLIMIFHLLFCNLYNLS